MPAPRTRYTKSGGVNIAYQVIGDGPIDLVYTIGWVSNIDVIWEEPSYARFLERLASFTRLIIYDKRGTGLSDRVSVNELPTMEQRMDDVRAVMDAAGSEKAALLGISEGGPLCILMAATYPARVRALILIGAYAAGERAADAIGARTPEEWHRMITFLEENWGEEASNDALRARAPSVYNDPQFRRWWDRYLRSAASPGAVVALTEMNEQIDVRSALLAISVPSLILHADGDRAVFADNGRYLAQSIRGARYIEYASQDHLPWVVPSDANIVASAIEELLTGKHSEPEHKRLLVTVLYTDTVESTAQGAQIGDERWRNLIETHQRLAREEVERQRGRLLKWTGDGIVATFDGPARAIRAACNLRDALASHGISTRAGLHTGECEVIGDDLGGIAMSIGSRVESLASPGEVLVSSTVKDLVAGSGIEFADRGEHTLKGVPGQWRILAVERA
jgi:pimeloyl-ACP methyl ester carboxylesterase